MTQQAINEPFKEVEISSPMHSACGKEDNMKKLFKSAVSFAVIISLVLSINRPAFAYPQIDTWYLVHNNYVSNLTKIIKLNPHVDGYYGKITYMAGSDPANGVKILCPSHEMDSVTITTANVDAFLHPTGFHYYDEYVSFKVKLLYNELGGYYSSNQGRIKQEDYVE